MFMHILVADDHLETLEMMTILLSQSAHIVLTARDGDEVVNLLQRNVPDVMMLDLALPKKDGFEIAEYTRKFPRFHDTRLIAFTGYANIASIERAAQAGFDYFLAKPATPNAIELFLNAPKPKALALTSMELQLRSQRLISKAASLSKRAAAAQERSNFLQSLYEKLKRR
jgi:CheY-like chemotaxis protein